MQRINEFIRHRERSERIPRHLTAAIALLPLLSAQLLAQGDSASARVATYLGKAGLIYGSRYAFIVRAPAAWTLDNKSGRRQGLQVVLYPAGESWAKSPSVMYCQVVPKGGTVGNVDALIAQEEGRFRSQSPEATVEQAPTVRAGDSALAVLRRFSGGKNHTFEATAYIEERTVIVSLILSCRSKEAFDDAQAAFTSLIHSYRFLADDDENILRALEAVEAEEQQ